ncbi:MAG: response regulator [Bacteroidota bacterium]
MRKIEGLDCILLVDDDSATNFIHKRTIDKAKLDCRVEICESAQQGLDFLTCSGKYTYNTFYPQAGIIFLDINMPGMSGWDFLKKYAALEKKTQNKVVISMLTTSLNPADEKKASTFPEIKAFFNKPLTIGTLNDLIVRHFEC